MLLLDDESGRHKLSDYRTAPDFRTALSHRAELSHLPPVHHMRRAGQGVAIAVGLQLQVRKSDRVR